MARATYKYDNTPGSDGIDKTSLMKLATVPVVRLALCTGIYVVSSYCYKTKPDGFDESFAKAVDLLVL